MSLVFVAVMVSVMFAGIGGARAASSPFTDTWVGYPPSVIADLNDALSTKARDSTGNAELNFGVTVDSITPPKGSDNYYEVGFTTTLLSHVSGMVGYSYLVGSSLNPSLWTNGANQLTLADNGGQWVSMIDWYFPYYGAWYDRIFVSANGFILLGQSGAANTTVETVYTTKTPSSTYPNQANPNGVIAPLWRDLNPSSVGRIGYGWYMIGGYETFVVAWEGVRNYKNSNTQSFAIWLQAHNSGGLITFVYKTLTKDVTTTVGMENPFGTAGVGDLYSRIAVPTSNAMSSVDFIPSSYNSWQITDVKVYAMKTYNDVGGFDKEAVIRIQGASDLGWGGLNVKLYNPGPSNPPPDFTDRTHRYINRVVDELISDVAGANPVTGFLWGKYNYVKDLYGILTDYQYSSETTKDEPQRDDTFNAMAENLPQNNMNPADKVFHLWTAPVFKWMLYDDETKTPGGLAAHDHNIAFWAEVTVKRSDGSTFPLATNGVSFTIAKSGVLGLRNGFYDNFDDGFIENPTYNPGSLENWHVITGTSGVVSISPQGLGYSPPYSLKVQWYAYASGLARVVSPALRVDFTRDYSIVVHLNMTGLGSGGRLVVVDDGRLEAFVQNINGIATLCVAKSGGGYIADRALSFGQWHMITIMAYPSQGNFRMFVDSAGGMASFPFKSSTGYATIGFGSSSVSGGRRDAGQAYWDDVAVYGYLLPYPPLTATGTASTTSGVAPVQVSFTCTPSGGLTPYSYSWAFGDGTTSTAQNPVHIYTSPGTYVATVTVTDSVFQTARWTSPSITVSPPLSVVGTASPTSGVAPLTVSFTATASGGTAPYTYSWAFGDGGTSTTQNPSHVYSSGGTYSAVVTARDSASRTAQWSATITVSAVDLPPTAPGTPVWPSGDERDGVYTLSWAAAGDSDGTPVAKYWLQEAVGGGSWTTVSNQITGTSYGLTFRSPATYTYRVCAIDTAGLTGPWSPTSANCVVPWDIRLTSNAGTSSAPAIAVDNGGNYHIAWVDNSDGNNEIYYKEVDPNWNTIAEQRISNSAGDSISPSIAFNSGRRSWYVVVAWADNRNGHYEIFTRTCGKGIWGAETLLVSVTGADCKEPCVAPNPSSAASFDYVYRTVTVSGTAVYETVWYTGTLGTNLAVSPTYYDGTYYPWPTASHDHLESPRIAVGSTGIAHVVFGKGVQYPAESGTSYVYYTRYVSGAWQTVVALGTTVDEPHPCAIDTDSSGGVYVVWDNWGTSGSFDVCFRKSSDSGATWGSTVVFGTAGGHQSKPDITVDDWGDVCIVWRDTAYAGETNYEISCVKSTDYGSTWSSTMRMTNSAGQSYAPRVAIDFYGMVGIVFQDSRDAGNWEIYFTAKML